MQSESKWMFQCIFCGKIFNSGRALGGHQNAHRFEQRVNKRTHHIRLPTENFTMLHPHPMNLQANHPSFGYGFAHENAGRTFGVNYGRFNPRGGPWVQPAAGSNVGHGNGSTNNYIATHPRVNYYQVYGYASTHVPVEEGHVQGGINVGRGIPSAETTNEVEDGAEELDLELRL